MPVISRPPDFSVCRHYLDHLNYVIQDLGLDFVFAHADEDVYSRLVQIIWKHGDLYKKIIVMMGGFHQLLVRQRLIFKRHGLMGYKDWMVDAGTIAAGSVEKVFKGKHYDRCMRVLKECFDALVQFFVDDCAQGYEAFDPDLLRCLRELRKKPTSAAVKFYS